MKESAYTKYILPIWQEKNKDAKIFRNNTGVAFRGDYPIYFGVGFPFKDKRTGRMIQRGGGDYIGFKSVVITPDMIGKKVAIFLNLELKSAKGKESEYQKKFKEVVLEAGGISILLKEGEEIL